MRRIIWPALGILLLVEVVAPAQTCQGCHPREAAQYAKTGMARSFRAASAAVVPTTAQPHLHAASDTAFAIVQRGGKFFHRRSRGEFQEELEIHYVLGSGKHARTFLHQNSRGQLIELPLGWYAEKGGYFAMNPGFDSPHPETRRKLDYDCFACHNSYPKPLAPAPAEPAFPAVLPTGIDCQRCHGPGQRHAAAAARGASPAALRAAIVNPRRLPAARQDEVCLQCHLETTSTRLPSMMRRFDRPPFSYQPGQPLAEHLLTFDHAKGTGWDDKFEIVSAAYRLRQSQCFLNSKALTCTTCHAVHAAVHAAQTTAAKCSSCHPDTSLSASVDHPAGDDCTGCHMPKRRTEDAVHVVMTDHRITRRPPAGDLLATRAERHPTPEQEYRGAVVPYYPAEPGDLYQAVAQVLHGSNLVAGISQLTAALERQRPREAEFYVALGNAWQESQQPAKAAEAFEQAVRMKPASAREWRYLGIARQNAGNDAGAAEALRKAIALDARDAGAWYQLALLDAARGEHREAAVKARTAIGLDPDLLDAHNTLGASLTALADLPGAEAALRQALRVNPYFATAHGNLARLFVRRGDLTAALGYFAESVRLNPGFAPDRYDLTLTLTRLNRFADARPHAEALVQLDSKLLEGRMLLGGVLARLKDLTAAQREYEAAVAMRPDHGPAHLELARIWNARGDRAAMLAALQRAAAGSDGAAATFAREALAKLGN